MPTDDRAEGLASTWVGSYRLPHCLGAFFLVMAGINTGIVVADSTTYATFADGAIFSFVRQGWRDVVMTHPGVWIGLLAAGEIAIGLAFLGSAGWRRAAYGAAVAFHVALGVFGWAVWLWIGPALVILLIGARRDLAARQLRAVSAPSAGC